MINARRSGSRLGMSKGTIIYIGGFELPDRNAAAHRVMANGKILRDLDYDVVFLGVDSCTERGNGLRRNDCFGFECWSVPYPKGTLAWIRYIVGLPGILSFLKQARNVQVRGVICYNYPAIASLRIWALCKSLGLKMLSDATEWYDASAGGPIYRAIKYTDTILRMHLVHRLADGVITTSKFLTDFYASRRKITVELPTLFDTDNFVTPPRSSDRPNKKFIYMGSPFDAGRVNKQRTNLKERLDVCVTLFHQLYSAGERFSFDIYGITAEDYLHVFPEHSEPLREMSGLVCFHGRQPHALVLAQIVDSDFSIFFRDRTRVTLAGFPSKLAESISCGTPVISNTMVSLENYTGCPGLFLAHRGFELELLKKLMAYTPAEIAEIKRQSYESKSFDYRKYAAPVSTFLGASGV